MITLHAYGELEIHSTVAQNHFESIVNGQIKRFRAGPKERSVGIDGEESH